MNTNHKTFSSQEAQEMVQHHRAQAIIQLESLIDDLTHTLKLMHDGAICVPNNPETRLKQLREESSKAEAMQRLHDYLAQPDTSTN